MKSHLYLAPLLGALLAAGPALAQQVVLANAEEVHDTHAQEVTLNLTEEMTGGVGANAGDGMSGGGGGMQVQLIPNTPNAGTINSQGVQQKSLATPATSYADHIAAKK